MKLPTSTKRTNECSASSRSIILLENISYERSRVYFHWRIRQSARSEEVSMATVAILGLGAMGSRMATRLVEAGHGLRVYNRSSNRADALAARGATVATSPRHAARGADVVISVVTDDRASRDIWLHPETGALPALRPGTVAVESSTLTPTWVRELANQMADHRISLLDAPVVGSRPQAEAGKLIHLVGGDATALERVREVLSCMSVATHHLGEPGTGTVAKLVVNGLFGIQVAAVAELLGMAAQQGLDLARTVEVLGATPVVSPALTGAMASIRAEQFQALFPIDLVEKDFRYILSTSEDQDSRLPTASAVHAVFAKAQHAGFGGDNITGVAQLFLER
ncbi:MAG: NAD(P)-dependent oxidoreductase [Myxococcota bacterium]